MISLLLKEHKAQHVIRPKTDAVVTFSTCSLHYRVDKYALLVLSLEEVGVGVWGLGGGWMLPHTEKVFFKILKGFTV